MEALQDLKMLRPDPFLRNRDPFLREVNNAVYKVSVPIEKDDKFFKAAEDYALNGLVRVEEVFKPTKLELQTFQHKFQASPFNFTFTEVSDNDSVNCGIPEKDLGSFLPQFIINEVLTTPKAMDSMYSSKFDPYFTNYYNVVNMRNNGKIWSAYGNQQLSSPPGFSRSMLAPYAPVFVPKSVEKSTSN